MTKAEIREKYRIRRAGLRMGLNAAKQGLKAAELLKLPEAENQFKVRIAQLTFSREMSYAAQEEELEELEA